jgi:hypothetical protein
MESLWIENRTNAIGIETDPVFLNESLALRASPLWRTEDSDEGLGITA